MDNAKVVNDVMIDFNDLLDKGADRHCGTFKKFVGTYGSDKVLLSNWHNLCIDVLQNSYKQDALKFHPQWFPEAFKEKEKTYKIGDEFIPKWDNSRLILCPVINGNESTIMLCKKSNLGVIEVYYRFVNVSNPYIIPEIGVKRLFSENNLDFNDWTKVK